MNFWKYYLFAFIVLGVVIFVVHYNSQLSLPKRKPNNSSERYSGIHACEDALGGKSTFLWEKTLTSPLGGVPCKDYLIQNHYITSPLSEKPARK